MKLITVATLITLITVSTAFSPSHDRIHAYETDPKLGQSILKGRQLNPNKGIEKRMVKHNIAPAVSTDAYQPDSWMNAFQRFSSFMNANNNMPPSSFMGPPQPMIRCARYPCPNVQPPTRISSSPLRPPRHSRPPPRKSRIQDTSETEEPTTELEEATSPNEEEPENIESPEKEEYEQPEKAENENENERNENEKSEKAEKEETEHRPGPGEEA